MTQAAVHKQHAIDLHTRQAGDFDNRYQDLATDPYASTFTYGRKKIEELIDRELATFPRGTRALDVGCGTGFNVKRLGERGFVVNGIEPAEGMRKRAQANNPGVDIQDGDIEALPFASGTFDLIISIEVIRYLDNPVKGLADVARCLKPGGTAIITAAPLLSLNGYALINMLTSRVQVPTLTKVKHSFLTCHSAKRVMSEAGFAHCDVHGVFLGPWHALGRVSPRALRATLRACETVESLLADRWLLRDLSNHLVLVARR